MAIFRIDANNNFGSSELFHRRLLYKFFALAIDSYDPVFEVSGVKDYWNFENYFYGKVDSNFIPVVPNINYLKQLEGQDGNVLVFDFVAESFEKFQSFFQTPLKIGRLEPGTPISEPVPVRGFENREAKYQEYLINFAKNFNDILFEKNINNSIRNVKDFVREFFNFYFNTDLPILKSSYYMSSLMPGSASGLSILIADLDPSDDAEKIKFIESPNFEFYRKAAINSGFIIDKNVPWRLNIDLRSPVILEKYSSERFDGIPYISEVFSKYFTPAYTNELEVIKQTIFYAYRDFFERSPTLSDPARMPYCETEPMPMPTLQVVSESYSNSWWLGKYIEMKNKDSGHVYGEKDIKNLKNNAFSILTQDPIRYINLKFRLPYFQPGSLVFEKLKREFEESDEKVLDNFSEHVKMIVMNSINSIY